MFSCQRSGTIETISGSVALSAEHCEQLSRTVATCLGQGQPRLVFDLSRVPLIDSQGLETLLDIRDQCQQRGGGLVLARPNALCRDIFRATRLERELEIFPDTVEAMGSFAR